MADDGRVPCAGDPDLNTLGDVECPRSGEDISGGGERSPYGTTSPSAWARLTSAFRNYVWASAAAPPGADAVGSMEAPQPPADPCEKFDFDRQVSPNSYASSGRSGGSKSSKGTPETVVGKRTLATSSESRSSRASSLRDQRTSPGERDRKLWKSIIPDVECPSSDGGSSGGAERSHRGTTSPSAWARRASAFRNYLWASAAAPPGADTMGSTEAPQPPVDLSEEFDFYRQASPNSSAPSVQSKDFCRQASPHSSAPSVQSGGSKSSKSTPASSESRSSRASYLRDRRTSPGERDKQLGLRSGFVEQVQARILEDETEERPKRRKPRSLGRAMLFVLPCVQACRAVGFKTARERNGSFNATTPLVVTGLICFLLAAGYLRVCFGRDEFKLLRQWKYILVAIPAVCDAGYNVFYALSLAHGVRPSLLFVLLKSNLAFLFFFRGFTMGASAFSPTRTWTVLSVMAPTVGYAASAGGSVLASSTLGIFLGVSAAFGAALGGTLMEILKARFTRGAVDEEAEKARFLTAAGFWLVVVYVSVSFGMEMWTEGGAFPPWKLFHHWTLEVLGLAAIPAAARFLIFNYCVFEFGALRASLACCFDVAVSYVLEVSTGMTEYSFQKANGIANIVTIVVLAEMYTMNMEARVASEVGATPSEVVQANVDCILNPGGHASVDHTSHCGARG